MKKLITISMILIMLSACNSDTDVPLADDSVTIIPKVTVDSTKPVQTKGETTELAESYPGASLAYSVAQDSKNEIAAYPVADDVINEASDQLILHTELGDLLIVSSHLVDEVNNVIANPNEKILLIGLANSKQENLTPENFPLGAFHEKDEIVHLLIDDGGFAANTMGGWLNDSETFVIGFPVPDSATSYQLVWGENSPIDIVTTE